MDRGKTIQTVKEYQCPYCGASDKATYPAGTNIFEHRGSAYARYIKCNQCNETMNLNR